LNPDIAWEHYMGSLHGVLNFEIGGLDSRVFTKEYSSRVD